MHVEHHVIHLHTMISIPKGQRGMPNEKLIQELNKFILLIWLTKKHIALKLIIS